MTALPRQAPIPRAARGLGAPLWRRTQQRLRDRYGFDLNAADAESRVEALLAPRPNDAGLLLLRAAVLSGKGDDAQAEAAVQAALQHDPDLARAHTTLATLLVRRGDTAAALEHARRAAELEPGDATVLFNLGLAEHIAGQRGAAREAFAATRRALEAEGAMPPRRWWWRRRRTGGQPAGR